MVVVLVAVNSTFVNTFTGKKSFTAAEMQLPINADLTSSSCQYLRAANFCWFQMLRRV